MLKSVIAKDTWDHWLVTCSMSSRQACQASPFILLSLYEKVIDAVDQSENSDVVYLDFSNSFDKVPTNSC